jgi:hypothetical protein
MTIERLVSLYAAGVGLAMAGMWTVLYLAGAIPELRRAPKIGTHLLAEALTGLALLLSGFACCAGGGERDPVCSPRWGCCSIWSSTAPATTLNSAMAP